MGGKQRLAKYLCSAMLAHCGGREVYWEPFLGGGSVFAATAPYFSSAIGSDVHPDLILLWGTLLEGWEPPSVLSEGEWQALRDADPSPLRAFAGFGCSFGGRWFEGYARGTEDFAGETRRSLLRKIGAISGCPQVSFLRMSYAQVAPREGTVLYCDPPYNTTSVPTYRRRHMGAAEFVSSEFWEKCREWAAGGCPVFVSEYECPVAEAKCVFEAPQNLEVKGRGKSHGEKRVERLWYLQAGG